MSADVAGYVVRARRVADLSQRELAGMLGVSPSCIAKVEAGRQRMSADLLVRILELAGMRLAVLDADGNEHTPVAEDVARDNAGRRFPAHLDLSPPDHVPAERVRSPRYDRYPPRAWYQHRQARNMRRAMSEEPGDHPTAAELEQRRHHVVEERRAALSRVRASGVRRPECSCEVACWVEPGCLPQCTCQCEPGPFAESG
jgi:HTH-type transcriptional regulator/antitoxin HipB